MLQALYFVGSAKVVGRQDTRMPNELDTTETLDITKEKQEEIWRHEEVKVVVEDAGTHGVNVISLQVLTSAKHKIQLKDKNGTIIPCIFMSDETPLLMFVEKKAYPVYVTIGNILKDI
jgi:hypothetical protein